MSIGEINSITNKQFIWIVRYGLTEFPLVENLGPYDSDIHPKDGVEHAHCIAKKILLSCGEEESNNSPSFIFSSPFLRTTHTSYIIANDLKNKPRILIEEGLTEWLTPSLLVDPDGNKTDPRSLETLCEMFESSIDDSYQSLNPVAVNEEDDRDGAPRFIESEASLLKRAKVTFEKMIEIYDKESFVIVSHAPVSQAIALVMEGNIDSPQNSKLGPLPLGGVTLFSRVIGEDKWSMEFYGETDHMPGIYKPGIKEWSLPCLSK